MFADLIKEIKKLEQNTSYSMQILCDEEGYVDKECPDSKCLNNSNFMQKTGINYQIKIFHIDHCTILSPILINGLL